jgi:hypothetical protein
VHIRAKALEKWGASQAVEVVGLSQKMRDMLDKVQKFAKFNQTILITGESGVGKELFAKACYLLSARIKAPFVIVNCPQYSEGNVMVRELFGHVKGSFTGAIADHKGLFDAAEGGAVFLDEVGDLPLTAQTMLLRALAEKEVKPLGSNKTYSVDVRIIAATNRPLRDMAASGQFRQDLYFRLHGRSKYIEPDHFVSDLRQANLPGPDTGKSELFENMVEDGGSFWDVVHQPFLNRDLNRTQAREIISQGLLAARGSYRRMSVLFNIKPDQYQKFMDFLRHHRLKPEE